MEKQNKNCLKKQIKNQVKFTALGWIIVLNSQSCIHLPQRLNDDSNTQPALKEESTGLGSLMSSAFGDELTIFPSTQGKLDHLKTMREQYINEKGKVEEGKRKIAGCRKDLVQAEKDEFYWVLQTLLKWYENLERRIQERVAGASSGEIFSRIVTLEAVKPYLGGVIPTLRELQEERNQLQSQYNALPQLANSVENDQKQLRLRLSIAQLERKRKILGIIAPSFITEYLEIDKDLMLNLIRTKEEKQTALLSVFSEKQRIISIMNEMDKDQEMPPLDSERFDNRIRSLQEKIDQLTNEINRLEQAGQAKPSLEQQASKAPCL